MVSDADIVRRLTSVLRKADLSTTTTAAIRKQLEKDFGVDLSDRKAFIREQVDLYFQQEQAEEEENQKQDKEEDQEEEQEEEEEQEHEEEQGAEEESRRRRKRQEPDSKRFRAKIDRAIKASLPKEKKKRAGGAGGLNKVCGLSPELQAIIGETQLPRTQVVKQLWVYIREKDLQDPENRRKILCNDELRGLFGVDSTDMFKMNKLLSKHIWPLEQQADEEPKVKKLKMEETVDQSSDTEKELERSKNEKKELQRPKTEKKEPSRLKSEKREMERQKGEKKDNGKGRSSGLSPLSDALADFLGTEETEIDQHDVVKSVWDYIVENKLQDPSDKTTIICDEKLQGLFGCETFVGFHLTKLLAPHLKG